MRISLPLFFLAFAFASPFNDGSESKKTELENACKILGIKFEDRSNEALVNSSFRKLSLKYHPDKNNNRPEANAEFQELNNAKDLLLESQGQDSNDDGDDHLANNLWKIVNSMSEHLGNVEILERMRHKVGTYVFGHLAKAMLSEPIKENFPETLEYFMQFSPVDEKYWKDALLESIDAGMEKDDCTMLNAFFSGMLANNHKFTDSYRLAEYSFRSVITFPMIKEIMFDKNRPTIASYLLHYGFRNNFFSGEHFYDLFKAQKSNDIRNEMMFSIFNEHHKKEFVKEFLLQNDDVDGFSNFRRLVPGLYSSSIFKWAVEKNANRIIKYMFENTPTFEKNLDESSVTFLMKNEELFKFLLKDPTVKFPATITDSYYKGYSLFQYIVIYANSLDIITSYMEIKGGVTNDMIDGALDGLKNSRHKQGLEGEIKELLESRKTNDAEKSKIGNSNQVASASHSDLGRVSGSLILGSIILSIF